jgi:hypothetical protein
MTKPPKFAIPQGPYKGPVATAIPDAVPIESVVQPSFQSGHPSPEDTMIELLRSIDRRLAAIEKKLP